jgi:peptide deformylase
MARTNRKILEIKKYPHPILRKKCELVEAVSMQEIELFEKMVFTMRAFNGIGLAAPQIGRSRQLIVADTGEGTIKLANPQIIEVKGNDKMVEGCLSIPGADVEVKRRYKVTVKGLNEKGKIVEIKAKGLLARVLQHEIDHLKGKLIIDYSGL